MDIFIYELLFIIWIIFALLFPIMFYIPLYKWWQQNDPKKQYNCISIALLAYYKYNNIAYRIFNLFSQNAIQFKYDFWAVFIASIISGQAAGLVPGGLCTPKTLCESLIPTPYPLTPLPNGTRTWPTNSADWRTLLLNWTGQTTIPAPDNWAPVPNAWSTAPNNFLNAWGISEFSPSVIGFVCDSSDRNKSMYPDTLNPLLGLNGPAITGGWMGFLQYGDSFNEGGIDEADARIWSADIPQWYQNGKKKQCSGASVVSGAVGTAMGGAFAGAAAGSEVPIIGNILGGIIGGIIGALAGGAMGAWSGGCFG